MPIVTVQMVKGRDVAVKRHLAGEITSLPVDALDVKPEWVTVLFEELDRENWASGGSLHSDKYGPGYGKQDRIEPGRQAMKERQHRIGKAGS